MVDTAKDSILTEEMWFETETTYKKKKADFSTTDVVLRRRLETRERTMPVRRPIRHPSFRRPIDDVLYSLYYVSAHALSVV